MVLGCNHFSFFVYLPTFAYQYPVMLTDDQPCQLIRIMRKPAFCICFNKGVDQLRDNREADQRLCFRYIDSIIPLLPKSEISSLLEASSVLYSPVYVRPDWKP